MKRSIIILTAFALFFIVWYFDFGVRPFQSLAASSQTAHYLINYAIAGLIPVAALFLLHKPQEIIASMGVSRGFGTGIIFGILATLPMLIGYACIGTLDHEVTVDHLLTRVLIAGFFEELFFRGFIFGQLFRYTRWGFLPAALLTALMFGSLHLYQGHDFGSAMGAFAVTAAGSIFFNWIYVEWNYNLWCAIWLHTLMNLPWILFNVSTNGAVGGTGANMLRFGTIFLAIGLTISYKKRQGLPYHINLKSLIINHA